MSHPHDRRPAKRPDGRLRRALERRVADLVIGHPLLIVAVSGVIAAGGFLLASRSLALDADTNSLIGADRPFMRLYRTFLDEFGDLENLYVVVDSRPGDRPIDPVDEQAARDAVDLLLERLQAAPDLPEVHGRIEPLEQLAMATRAMATNELEDLADAGRVLPAIAEGDAAAALRQARLDLATLLRRGVLLDEQTRRELAAGSIVAIETALAAGETSGDSLAARPPPRYLTSETGRLHFIAILPKKDFNRLDAIRTPLAEIRRIIDEVRGEFPSLEIGLTGKPVLQADELATTDRDMVRAASVAGGVIAAMFMVVFRSVVRPLLAIVSFAMAFGWTYGLATLLVGHLNLLSIVFMLVLVGVGVDYGVHVVARYVEARRRRLSSGAVRVVMRTAVPGNVTGALTSSAVFLLALATEFQGLRELGLIAGGGLLLCMLAMTLDLPALLHLTERRGRRREPRPRPSSLDPVETVVRRRPAGRRPDLLIVAATIGLALAGAFIAVKHLRFETNPLELQAEGLESVEWEHRVFEDSTSASWFGAIVADDLDEAQQVLEAASRHPEIAGTASVLDLVPRPDERRVAARAAFRDALEGDGADVPRGDDVRNPVADLAIAADTLDRLAAAAAPTSPEEARRLADVATRAASLARELEIDDRGRDRIDLAFETAAANLQAMREGDRSNLRDAIPPALRREMIAPSGRMLVRLMPSEDLWQVEPLERFVDVLRQIDPEATGVPMTQLESIRDMSRAFVLMATLALAAVVLLVWLDFRSLAATAICTTALVLGIAWTVGAMAALGIPLNLANFFGIPILMGLGIDSAVHMVHRARESRGGRIHYGATARAVVLTAATTAIGFGSLIFAAHRGLQSLGMVMLLGSAACAAVAVLVVPALVRLAGWDGRPRASSQQEVDVRKPGSAESAATSPRWSP